MCLITLSVNKERKQATRVNKPVPKKCIFYLIVIIYLVLDFYVFSGPFRSGIKRIVSKDQQSLIEIARNEGVVATVNAHPIYEQEVVRSFNDYCLKNGIDQKIISKKRTDSIKSLCLNNLIIDKLVWFHSYHTPVQLSAEQVNEALIDFRKGFENSEEFNEGLKSQGFSISRLDAYVENQFMQRQWIERVISKYIQVSDEEILKRYEADKEARENPERFKVQQIFFASLNKNPIDLRKKVSDVFEELESGSGFELMVGSYSEDPQSKSNKGHLNWLTKERVEQSFYDQIQNLNIGEISQPFETKIGWHIVRLVDRKVSNKLPLHIVKKELAAAIEAEKRYDAIKALINYMKRKAKIRYISNMI